MGMKTKFLFTALTAVALLTACSDDSSSGNPADPATQPGTDTTQVNQQQTTETNDSTQTTNPADVQGEPVTGDSTATLDPPPTNPEQGQGDSTATQPGIDTNPGTQTSGCAEGEIPAPVEFPLTDFVDVGEVYKAIQCNEKVVFLVRHGEREAGIGSESPLTEDGALEAEEMGAKLTGDVDFTFIHSGFLRTYQTVEHIAIGRGQGDRFVADTIRELADGWFLKDKDMRDSAMKADSITNVNVMYAAWVYDGSYADIFYDLEARSNELLNTYVIKDFAQMPKYTVIASHDQVLMPLTAFATQKQINLRLHDPTSRNWLCYLAGVAVIINDQNQVRYVPIKGGVSGII